MASERRTSNPFATSRVRPGALTYDFPQPDMLDRLLAKIADGPEHQIVGPHGSGKSTLVQTLMRALESRGWRCEWVRIGPDESRCDSTELKSPPDSAARRCLFVDGWERLSRWNRWRLRRTARRRAVTLVATAHEDLGLPTLLQMQVSRDTLYALVDRLQAGHRPLVRPADVDSLWVVHQPNVRELLFGLYDLYEQRRAAAAAPDDS